jgi:hypothetical protein
MIEREIRIHSSQTDHDRHIAISIAVYNMRGSFLAPVTIVRYVKILAVRVERYCDTYLVGSGSSLFVILDQS